MIHEVIQGWKNLLFGREKDLSIPSQRAIIEWNPYMVEKGYTDDYAKEIHLFRYGVKRTYPFSKRFLEHLRDEGRIPIFDNTDKEVSPEVLASIDPGEYHYV